MEESLKRTIAEYRDIVAGIDTLDISQEERVARTKEKLRLFDGSVLRIREIRVGETLEAYSYYWLRSNETIIIGWDNAPHHREISTFPHHRHTQAGIGPSQERNLREVLKFIRHFFA